MESKLMRIAKVAIGACAAVFLIALYVRFAVSDAPVFDWLVAIAGFATLLIGSAVAVRWLWRRAD